MTPSETPFSGFSFEETAFKQLMQKRIHKVLVICSDYDFYMLEEDGRIDEHIFNEYVSLNLRYPPVFLHARSAREALLKITHESIDLVIEMLSTGDTDAFRLAKEIKQTRPGIPIVVLTHFSRDVSLRLEREDLSAIDHVFCWLGNPDIFLAIIKLIEDAMNAEHDMLTIGVQSILLVEDSVRYISSYLPYLYRIVLEQSREFAAEALNEHQQMLRRRGRPKILLVKNYAAALHIYKKYRGHFLGIISDVSYKAAPTLRDTKSKAGLKFCQWIHQDDPTIPVLLQSSDADNRPLAQEQGAGFLFKYSKTIYLELRDYILQHFGFGDFVFIDPQTGRPSCKAANLKELQKLILNLPDAIVEYHTRNDDFSRWLNARALFTIARHFKEARYDDFQNAQSVRQYIYEGISSFRASYGRGIIAEFSEEKLDLYLYFSRIGQGGLGGKARGLAFMNSRLRSIGLTEKYPGIAISVPPTIVLTTDVYDEFMQSNQLYSLTSEQEDDAKILQHFIRARLPRYLSGNLLRIAQSTSKPLAVRSSSRLEDSLYQPFAGVYNTYMISPQPNPADTALQLELAIKGVYASAFFQPSKKYLAALSNLLDEEKMGIIIQTVCGKQHGNYFYPTLSGVARSLNYYPTGKEKTKEGIVELAFGLGKQIVEGGVSLRFSPFHPKNILQLSTPELALKNSQKKFYALHTSPGKFQPAVSDKINLEHLDLSTAEQDPVMNHVLSTYDYQNQTLRDGITEEGKKLITFSGLLTHNSYPIADLLKDLLYFSSEALNHPVEIEFAAQLPDYVKDALQFNYLQVRPIRDTDLSTSLDFSLIPVDSIILQSQKAMGHGVIESVLDVVLVKTEGYNPAHNKQLAVELAQINSLCTDWPRTMGFQRPLVGYTCQMGRNISCAGNSRT